MDTTKRYPTDLTNREWAQVCCVIPAPKTVGRLAKYNRREIVNALLHITRAGCPWRMPPKDLPPWRIAYWYFMQWKKDGTFGRLTTCSAATRWSPRVGSGSPRPPSSTPSRSR